MNSVPLARYQGRKAQAFTAQVLAMYGRVCWLCGRWGADSADHVIPRSKRPDLTWDLSNARPAHRRCNSERGARPASPVEIAPGW